MPPAVTIDTFTRGLEKLITKFEADKAHYLSKNYVEAQARVDFITPFFKSLGWDVENEAGLAHHEREVFVERGEHDTPGRPDYSFRVAGQTKFFVEAKAPSETLDDPRHTFQAKSYAWNTKIVFFTALTDFEESRFYDATLTPDERKPNEGLLLKLKYTEYLPNAKRLWEFSRERVVAGSLDAYLPRARRARPQAPPVDEAFLDEMTGWREELARNIYKNNHALTARQLNEIVQRLLDRIVFIRIAEDRRIIEKMQLWEAAEKWRAHGDKFPIIDWLLPLFERINDDFNGEIFKPNSLLENTQVDSEVLAKIIERLYPPKSPYRFDVIGVELLGSIYERYLGKTIRVTPKQVRLEDKPEVRKAGGVYYTPKYIVDYIVKNTVGKLIEGKTPRQIEKIRILDPACGSGSFLIGAFQCLIEYHTRYLSKDPEKAQAHALFPDISTDPNGEPRLSVIRKAQILKNNLFGVDIDPQAVEITMMSLYLKALEGERSLLPPKQHLLPELKNNIICGNSLIGPDFYKDQQLSFIDDEEKYRVNVFDWQTGFPEIVKAGGFDAVVGNPPWGGDIDRELKYFHFKYPATTQDHTDVFKLFIEAGIRLAQDNGFASMIVPNTVLRQRRLRDVRQLLLKNSVLSVVDLGEDVFKGVVAPSCIYVIRKRAPQVKHIVEARDLSRVPSTNRPVLLLSSETEFDIMLVQSAIGKNTDFEFAENLDCARESIRLGDMIEFKCKDAGINYQRVGVGMRVKGDSDLADRLFYEGKRQRSTDRMYWKGEDIGRYWVSEVTRKFCRPDVKTKANEVVHLNNRAYETIPKILLRQTADTILATLDRRGIWFGRSVIAIVKMSGEYSVEYLLGIVNSTYLRHQYDRLAHETGRVFAQVKLSKLKQLPIRTIDFSKREEKAQHDKIVALVERMLELNKKKHSGKLAPSEIDRLEREIAATDAEIDNLVYELYAITAEERKIIEAQK